MSSKTPQWARVCEGKTFIYYIGSDGSVIKISHKLKRQSNVKIFKRRGHATVKINGMDMRLKNLVAKHHMRGWFPGCYVECLNGNPDDCHCKNLRIYTRSEHGKRTCPRGRSLPVIVEGVRYESVLEASRALYVSDQTIWDYLNRKRNRSILEGKSIKLEGCI